MLVIDILHSSRWATAFIIDWSLIVRKKNPVETIERVSTGFLAAQLKFIFPVRSLRRSLSDRLSMSPVPCFDNTRKIDSWCIDQSDWRHRCLCHRQTGERDCTHLDAHRDVLECYIFSLTALDRLWDVLMRAVYRSDNADDDVDETINFRRHPISMHRHWDWSIEARENLSCQDCGKKIIPSARRNSRA